LASVYTASTEPGVYNGTIVAEYVTTSESVVRAVRVPYRITVLAPLLGLPNLDLTFFVAAPPFNPIRRSLQLTNHADRSLLISNVTVPPQYSGLFAVRPRRPSPSLQPSLAACDGTLYMIGLTSSHEWLLALDSI